MKSELKRKDDILEATKVKLEKCEEDLKLFGISLDKQLKHRLEMSTHGYLPNDNLNTQASTINNPIFEQQTSTDNNVILLQ